MAAIAGGHLDAARLADVETQLVVDHDDVRPSASGTTGVEQRHFQPFGGNRVRFHKSVVDEIGDCRHAGAGKFRQIAIIVIASPGFLRHRDGITDKCRQTGELASEGRQAAHTKRIEPPQRIHQRENDEHGQDHRPAQIGKDRKQKCRGIAIDHHQVDEVGGHLDDVVLQPREQDQQHDQRQRQGARQSRPPQQCDPEEVQNSP